ncbi:MAG TPA: acyl-CoA thioesterase [Bdellovibrionota bacterium]|nr:acyl-CoA thioesterase [Bdellovibrionota bacterium]
MESGPVKNLSLPRLRRTRATKTPRDSAFLTRKIVSPDLLNPNGTLFGGVIMSWIDEVAFMSARRYSGRPFVVTSAIDNNTFLMPHRTGDHVILTSQVNYAGRTSMEIGVKVEREDAYTGERQPATSAYLTFVALDKRGKPAPIPELKLENAEDQRRHDEAVLRQRVRARIRTHLKKKYERAAKAEAAPGATNSTAAVRPLLAYPAPVMNLARTWWSRIRR